MQLQGIRYIIIMPVFITYVYNNFKFSLAKYSTVNIKSNNMRSNIATSNKINIELADTEPDFYTNKFMLTYLFTCTSYVAMYLLKTHT